MRPRLRGLNWILFYCIELKLRKICIKKNYCLCFDGFKFESWIFQWHLSFFSSFFEIFQIKKFNRHHLESKKTKQFKEEYYKKLFLFYYFFRLKSEVGIPTPHMSMLGVNLTERRKKIQTYKTAQQRFVDMDEWVAFNKSTTWLFFMSLINSGFWIVGSHT